MSIKRSVDGGLNSTSNDFSRRDILILSAGAVAVSTTAFCGTAQAAGETEHHGLSAFGDLELSGRFQTSEIRQSRRPEGRHLQPARRRRHGDLQLVQRLHPQGRSRDRHGAGVRRADVARRPTSPTRSMPMPPTRSRSRPIGRVYKFHLRDGITFHDGSPIKAEDVAFSLTTLKTKGHPAIGNLLRDMETAETEGDRVVVVRFATKPRAQRAAHGRQPADLVEGLLLEAGLRRNLDGAAARLRSLQGRQVRAGPLTWNSNASRIGGARSCRSCAVSTISTCCTTTITATAIPRSKASPPRATRSARSSRRGSGRRATTSRRSRTAASSARPSPTTAPPACKPG